MRARGAFTPIRTRIRASRIVSKALRETLEGFFLGVGHDSPHLAALVDFMEVAGWIEPDPGADPIGRGEVDIPVRRITGRGAQMLTADLYESKLQGANLQKAQVTDEQLADTRSLQRTTMPDGSKYS